MLRRAFYSLLLLLPLMGLSHAQSNNVAYLLDLKGAVAPATADYVRKGLEKALQEQAKLIVLKLDTPGGLDSSMREIIQGILASPIPVATFVAPKGARAASAGTYILYASHVAAMSPGTNLGAATPVQIGGGGSPFPLPKETGEKDKGKDDDKDEGGKKAKPKPTMADKAVNDAVAYIRSLAQLRKRNAEWAEKAVREAASLPAEEALKESVIDLLANSVGDLLMKLDGRVVTVQETDIVLETKGLVVKSFEADWRTKLLGIITDPNVAYILMLIGIYGLILEFYNPGVLIPGVVGAICLVLAFYAFNVLPINYAGLALILLGIGLITAEAFAPSFGILGIGGVAAFVIGSVMLLDTDVPGFQISWAIIGSIAAVGSGLLFLVMYLLVKSRDRPVVMGPEELIGKRAKVIDWDEKSGHVKFRGEIWNARSTETLHSGSDVVVDTIEGLTLVVQPEANGR